MNMYCSTTKSHARLKNARSRQTRISQTNANDRTRNNKKGILTILKNFISAEMLASACRWTFGRHKLRRQNRQRTIRRRYSTPIRKKKRRNQLYSIRRTAPDRAINLRWWVRDMVFHVANDLLSRSCSFSVSLGSEQSCDYSGKFGSFARILCLSPSRFMFTPAKRGRVVESKHEKVN